MTPGDPQHYRYLNRAGRWEGAEHAGLERRPDGGLQLPALPRLDGAPPAGLDTLPAPDGVAGVLGLAGGVVLFTDPAAHRLLLVDPCDGRRRPVACLAGPGDGPEQLRVPRGLARHHGRDAVLVADSGNDRVVVLDRAELRTTELWAGLPGACSVACDGAGGSYVVTAGGGLVKLDGLGRVDGAFAADLAAGPPLDAAEVAVDGERVLVLTAAGDVRVLDPGGGRVDAWGTGLAAPGGLAAGGGTVLLGDRQTRRLVVFAAGGGRRGEAVGYAGPVAATACDGEVVLVHPGGPDGPLRLRRTGGFASHGVVWAGPVHSPDDTSAPRHRVRAEVVAAAGAHVRLHVCEQPAGDPPPPVDPLAADPFADPRWRRAPIAPDATETLLAGAPLDELWVGAILTGDGTATPVLHQVRIDFAHPTYLEHLPALYQHDRDSAELLARLLTTLESGADTVQAGIDGLVERLDPHAAPADGLPWLAGWLALELPDGWDEHRRRAAVDGAFAATAQRGTVAGLRAALRDRAGVRAVVEEPLQQTGWWVLAAQDATEAEAQLAVLGAGTVLAAAAPQGAVLGTTAVLDGSRLLPQDAYAEALFADVAHQFTVRLYRGPGHSEDAVAAARAVLDAERPAHTAYHLCVVEPRLRVGVQARLGIDAIVAGDPEPTLLPGGGTAALILGGPPPAHLGADTRIGQAHLTHE